jgi:guanylate kinase
MYNIIALIGEAGSGKDFMMKKVLEREPTFHEIVSCTTRPKREGEIDGVNYHYYSPTEFSDKVLSKEMIEYTKFNNWMYGTGYDSLDENRINIGVFNPEGIRSLLAHPKCNVIVFYVRAADKTRLLRQLNREEDPNVKEIIRRYSADEIDFGKINFSYHSIKNNGFDDLSVGLDYILKQSKTFFSKGQDLLN